MPAGLLRLARRRDATYVFCLLCYVALGVQGFLAPPSRGRLAASRSAPRRSMVVVRLGVTPPGGNSKRGTGGGGAAAADESGRGYGDGNTRITRAPLRITPNFQPQDKRRPKTDAIRDAFLTEASFDMAGEIVKLYSISTLCSYATQLAAVRLSSCP